MIEWIEKAGVCWDRAGNVEKETGGAYYVVETTFIQCVPVPWASAEI